MVSFEMNDRKKIGLGLTGFGIFFSFLGIIFFFDKGLLAMGNVNPLLVRGDTYHWTKVHYAILYETPKFQGDDFIRHWLLFSCYRMANFWHDLGDIWVHRAFQWLLANTRSFSSEDTYSWLVYPTAIYRGRQEDLHLLCNCLKLWNRLGLGEVAKKSSNISAIAYGLSDFPGIAKGTVIDVKFI
ncbi:hypothetical protein FEM48_Zijuj07G0028000 [Ziziphus jujuba var. spinosa]|uniref:Uncharacterized protein n=1 Tax=Ziziphus jujuba var. spinosa TaxID=714518 RepID=A0A978V207_ZIZJJ|nr:hypothetical protein FEM48_Zijuj07G0028000 [Ziziphus jujuba var. spinosa]